MENSVKWYIARKIMVVLSQVCLSLIILYKTTKNFLLLYESEFIFYSSEGSTVSLTTIALETIVVVLTVAALSMFFVEIIRSHAGVDFQSILRIFLKLLFLYAAGGLFVLILLDRVDLMEQIVSLFLVKALLKKKDQYLDKKEKERLVQSGYFQLQRKTEISELSINLSGMESIEHQEKLSSSVEYLYQFKYYPFTLVVANSDSSDPKFIDSGEAAFTRLFLISLTVYFSFLFAVNGEISFYLPGIVALLFLWTMRNDIKLLINLFKERLTSIQRNDRAGYTNDSVVDQIEFIKNQFMFVEADQEFEFELFKVHRRAEELYGDAVSPRKIGATGFHYFLIYTNNILPGSDHNKTIETIREDLGEYVDSIMNQNDIHKILLCDSEDHSTWTWKSKAQNLT